MCHGRGQGGLVHQSAIPMRQGRAWRSRIHEEPGFGPPVLVRVGPERVWDKTGRCGLCVTRSLGAGWAAVMVDPFSSIFLNLAVYDSME